MDYKVTFLKSMTEDEARDWYQENGDAICHVWDEDDLVDVLNLSDIFNKK